MVDILPGGATQTARHNSVFTLKVWHGSVRKTNCSRGQLKCDGTRAETRFRLSRETDESIQIGGGRQFSRLLAAEVCASAVVMLDTPCSEVV